MPLIENISQKFGQTAEAALSSLRSLVPNQWKDNDIEVITNKTDPPPEHPSNGSLIINGVTLSPLVAEQLRHLGRDLSWYTEAELKAAVLACSIDCNLIDDPNGVNFYDDLELSELEREEDDGEIDIDARRGLGSKGQNTIYSDPEMVAGSVFYDPQFREKIRQERERERERRRRGQDSEDNSRHYAANG